MPDSLAHIKARLDRAEEHLKDFEFEVQQFLRDNRCTTVRKRDAKGRYYLFHIKRRPEPPIRLSLIAADCVHSLRSTLDHTVYLLALKKLGRGQGEGTAFPICASKSSWSNERTKRRIRGVPAKARRIIEAHQPYHGGHPRTDKRPSTFRDHPLWWLDRLWQRDKHRGLTVTVWRVSGHSFEIVAGDHTAVAYVPWFGDLDKGSVVGKVAILKPDAKVRFKMVFIPQVEFEKRSPCPKSPAVMVLQDLDRQVRQVVKELTPYLSDRRLTARRPR